MPSRKLGGSEIGEIGNLGRTKVHTSREHPKLALGDHDMFNGVLKKEGLRVHFYCIIF